MKLKTLLSTGCLAALASAFPAIAQESQPVNVLLNKAVIEVAGDPAAESEGPDKLIDGDHTTKYCIIQKNPYVVIDALGYFNFSSFKFYDCKTNEDEENASAYRLELSMDGKTWQTAADAADVAAIDLKEISLAAPLKARYVKFSPTYGNCARMWELEGYGEEATTLAATLQTENLTLDIDAVGEIKVVYSIIGDKGEDFAVSANSSKSNVFVDTPVDSEGTITVPVKGVSKGKADVTVTITNNGEVASFSIPVQVNSDEPADMNDCIEVKDWSKDIIIEGLPADGKADTYLISGWYGGSTFYTSSVKEEGALCGDDCLVEAASGNIYKLADPAGKNATLVDDETPVAITFADPLATEEIHLLAVAVKDVEDLAAVIKYEDGSESDPVALKISAAESEEPDGMEAVYGLGLIEPDIYGGGNDTYEPCIYRLYELTVPADQYKNALSVELSHETWRGNVFILGVNAHNVNGAVTKHLSASLAEQQIRVKQGQTANIVVNYKLTDIEGLEDKLTYAATPSKDAIKLGDIVLDETAGTITIPVEGVTPAIATVDINLAFGAQTMKLVAQILVKTTVTADETNCVEISDWASDVIVEATPSDEHANQKLDDSGWVFFTDDIHPEGAIAGDERLVVAASGNVYKLAEYNRSNATVIVGVGGIDVSRNVTLATPIFTEALNLLGVSANGEADLDITVNFENDTKAAPYNVQVADWFANTPEGNEAVYGLGRIHMNNGDIATERGFRLFEITVPCDRTYKVKSININNKTALNYFTLLGVNAVDMKTSGLNGIEEETASREVVAVYNLQGQQVENPVNGLYIFRYSDGSSAKVLVK